MGKIKKTIEQFLNNGNLPEAKKLIEQYENLHPKDMDLLIYKIIYNIYCNNNVIAKELCLLGIQKYPTCGDIYYNLGYIYELDEDYFNAYENYYKAMYIYANYETNKLAETNVENIIIKLEDKVDEMYQQAEEKKDLNLLKKFKKLFDLEEGFLDYKIGFIMIPRKM